MLRSPCSSQNQPAGGNLSLHTEFHPKTNEAWREREAGAEGKLNVEASKVPGQLGGPASCLRNGFENKSRLLPASWGACIQTLWSLCQDFPSPAPTSQGNFSDPQPYPLPTRL